MEHSRPTIADVPFPFIIVTAISMWRSRFNLSLLRSPTMTEDPTRAPSFIAGLPLRSRVTFIRAAFTSATWSEEPFVRTPIGQSVTSGQLANASPNTAARFSRGHRKTPRTHRPSSRWSRRRAYRSSCCRYCWWDFCFLFLSRFSILDRDAIPRRIVTSSPFLPSRLVIPLSLLSVPSLLILTFALPWN